jgi:uncharacterized protein
MRVFLDANVLFSAANAGSNIACLISLHVPPHQPVTSDFAWFEAERNVLLKRPEWATTLLELRSRLEIVPSVLFELPIALDDKDRPILCAAIRSQCEFLVTGDRRHFGHFYNQTVEGVTIVSLVGLAERICK